MSFLVVPGLAAEQNRPIPSHIGVHEASLRLYANVALNPGGSISAFSTDPAEEVQEIDDMPLGPPDVNKSVWPGSLVVHGDRMAYTLAMNVDTNHTLALCLRALDPGTGLIDEGTRVDVVMDTEELPSPDEPSGGLNSELAVCPQTGQLMALFFADGGHPLFGKLLVSKSAFAAIGAALDWSTEFDAWDLPAYVGGWELGTAQWPLRLGVGPDGRVFVAGLGGDPSTVRIAYSDDQGQTWSPEVDTGVEQGFLGPQIAFAEDGANYYVYASSSVSTNRGESGSWYMTGHGLHAPCADPNDPELLYLSSDQLGLGYSTNAISTETYQDHNLADWLEINVATYSRGIEAVEIMDFDFTADKTVGWTASGQGVRWTTNLNAGAGNVVWSEPIMPAAAPGYHAVAIDPNTPGGATVYAADNRHVYRSEAGFTDAAEDWVQVLRSGTYDPGDNPGGYEMDTVRRLAVHPGDSNRVAVGYQQWFEDSDDMTGVLYTEDYGATWTNLLFNGDPRCDVHDLRFVGGQLFVATSWNPEYPANTGVFRVDSDNGWTVHQELDVPIKTRSLAADSAGNLYAVGVTTNGTRYGYGGEPVAYWRPAGGTVWEALGLEGLPENPGPAQPANAFVTVGIDGTGTEAVLMTFGRGLYTLREDGWVRIHQYPFQTELHVLKWDELTLGSGSGLYAQDTGKLDGNVLHVSAAGSNEAPYDTWEKAAHEIQDALNLAVGGDLVLVGDGEYDSGGMEVNGLMTRVVVPDYVELRSANGAAATLIRGAAGTGTNAPYGPDAVRGAYVGQFARMQGFTVTGGHTDWAADEEDEEEGEGGEGEEGEEEDDDEAYLSGGGVYVWGGEVSDCVVVSNAAMMGGGVFVDGEGGDLGADNLVLDCDIEGNTAEWGGGGLSVMDGGEVWHCRIRGNAAQWGGGAVIEYEGVLGNCLVTGNESLHEEYDGSGVLLLDGGTIESCTIAANAAAATNGCAVRAEVDDEEGGGATTCGEMLNSIVFGNSNVNYAPADVAAATLDGIEFSCAPELTAGVDGNLNGDPQWMDAAGGDYRLAEGSPCVNTGTNQDWMAGAEDLGGNPRIVDAVVDMGAYEVQPPVLSVTPGVRNVDAGAGTTTFDVENTGEGTMTYTAATSDGWLEITAGGSGTNEGTLTVGYEANSGATARTGTVTVTAAGATGSPVEVTVVQAGGGAPAWDDGYTDLGGGWRRLGWFGDYAVMALEGWIWHNQHGFFYVSTASVPGDVWLYANDMGWLYTGDTLYPFLFRGNDSAWLWYNGSTNPRWFMNFTSGQWENRP
ncbi:MAG: BACON domain-containing protein [Lentisphaerae bacterium]|nr:BACON domain-containing protein [Lentisphaerota bacterium]